MTVSDDDADHLNVTLARVASAGFLRETGESEAAERIFQGTVDDYRSRVVAGNEYKFVPPTLAWCTHRFANHHFKLEDWDEAEHLANEAYKLYADLTTDAIGTTLANGWRAENCILLARIHNARRRELNAIQYATKAIKLSEEVIDASPKLTWNHNLLIQAWLRMSAAHLGIPGNEEKALHAIDSAIDRFDQGKPGFPERYHERRGHILLALDHRVDEAEAAFGKAIRKSSEKLTKRSDDKSVCRELSLRLSNCPIVNLREPQRALSLAKVGFQPNHGFSLLCRGIAEFRADAYADAVESLTELSLIHPDGGDAFAHCILSMSQWKLGNLVDAKSSLEIAKSKMVTRGIWLPQQLSRIAEEASRMINDRDS